MHVAAVGPDRDADPVRTFRTFTDDLHRLADWFARCGVKTVAMESTGVYWIPVFEILEQRGFEVMVVNARDAKHVPGRKTDVSDAEWLQRLHEYGLLRPSLRPRSPGCVRTSGSGSGYWITRRRTFSTCRRN
jgi:transposase